ncbi:MAG: ParA family protein [Treponema sp.]|nr:ParA family protein [Candidatus Treponema equifaecale]
MKTICFYNHKGGVGKTTLTAAIAGELISEGQKVLLLDTDSQANLTSLFCEGDIQYELADYLFNSKDTALLSKIIRETKYDNLYIIPNKKLSAGGRIDEWARSGAGSKENRNVIPNLMKMIESCKIDFVLIDMPPSYSELDKEILLASDEVIPILKIDTFSVEGIKDFYLLLEKLKDGDSKPEFKKYIFNCKDLRTSMQRTLLEQIENINFKKYIVPTDTIFEKSKASRQLIQAMNGTKTETQKVLSEIAADLMEGK